MRLPGSGTAGQARSACLRSYGLSFVGWCPMPALLLVAGRRPGPAHPRWLQRIRRPGLDILQPRPAIEDPAESTCTCTDLAGQTPTGSIPSPERAASSEDCTCSWLRYAAQV